VSLERTRLEADLLSAQNAELEALVRRLNEAHAALEERTTELEALQEQFRDQADRD